MRKRKSIGFALILLCVTILATVTSTYAWFAVAGYVRLHQMEIYISGGPSLRVDAFPHDGDITQYVKTLESERVSRQLQERFGFDLMEVALDPLTTGDGKTFYYEKENVSDPPVPAETDTGNLLEFTLYFIADKDMWLHLSTQNVDDVANTGTMMIPNGTGTRRDIVKCARMSFEVDGEIRMIVIPDEDTTLLGQAAQDAANAPTPILLPPADQKEYTDATRICHLTEGVETAVTVRLWLEGEDPHCNDLIVKAAMTLQLTFVGTEDDNTPVISF